MKKGFYLAGKLLAVIVTAIFMFETADTGTLLIRVLVFGCLFALQLLLGRIKNGAYKKGCRLCQAGALALAFFLGPDSFFLVVLTVGMELLDDVVKGSLFYEIGSVTLLLLWFIYEPEQTLLLFAAVFVVLLLFLRHIEEKRALLWQANMAQRKELGQLQNRLEEMRTYARTVTEQAVMEERNRFAARIHDKLGHSISGSIILLEATALQSEETQVKQNLKLVTENLRGGVDDIRAALKQERPERSRLGLQEIKRVLEEFQLTYGRRTALETEGDLEKISMPLWICIRDNLEEALTNMLKHSEGSAFTLRILAMNKAIRVEYTDNGRCMGEVTPGMGLGAIEERTAACGGTALFTGGQSGFSIVTVYL